MSSAENSLITASEIATRAQVSQAAVSNWRRRYADTFPAPVVAGLFDAGQVDDWLKQTGRIPKSARADARRWAVPVAGSGAVDEVGMLAYAASLVTLHHLHGPVEDLDPRALAGVTERAAGLPAGALAEPLALAGVLDLPMRDRLAHEVHGRLENQPAADVFEQLINQLEAVRSFQGHTTPAVLADSFAQLIWRDAHTVLDPACGVGSLLMAAAQRSQAKRLVGYEADPTAWALCVQRLVLHGLPTNDIHLGDFFAAAPTNADLVVADPAFTVRWPADSPAAALLARHGASPGIDGDFAWLFAARDALTETGSAVVLTPNRTTFAGGSTRALRHELLRSGAVTAVIGLPPGSFATTNIPATVWVLQAPTTRAGDVLLVNAQPPGSRTPDPSRIHAAAAEYRAWRVSPADFHPTPGLSAVVPLLELLAGDAELTPARWTESPAEPRQALAAAQAALEETAALVAAVGSLTTTQLALAEGPHARLVSLHHLETDDQLQVLRPRHINRGEVLDAGEHPVVTGITPDGPRIVGYLDQLPDHAVITRPGDVLLSTLSQVRATVDLVGGHVLGQGVWCIRPKADNPALAPDVLALLLASPRIGEQTVGTTVQRLRHPKDVTIPLLAPNAAVELAAAARQLAQTRRLSQQLTETCQNATLALAEALDAGITPAPARKGRR